MKPHNREGDNLDPSPGEKDKFISSVKQRFEGHRHAMHNSTLETWKLWLFKNKSLECKNMVNPNCWQTTRNYQKHDEA